MALSFRSTLVAQRPAPSPIPRVERRKHAIEMRDTGRLNKRRETFVAERAALDTERVVLDAEGRKLQRRWELESI